METENTTRGRKKKKRKPCWRNSSFLVLSPTLSLALSFAPICTALPDAKVNAPHNCVKQLRGGCLRMFGWLTHSSECDTLTPAGTVLLRGHSCHSVLWLTPHITATGRRPEASPCYLPQPSPAPGLRAVFWELKSHNCTADSDSSLQRRHPHLVGKNENIYCQCDAREGSGGGSREESSE